VYEWQESAAADFKGRAMNKSNFKISKKPKRSPAKKRLDSSSGGSRRANNGSAIASGQSGIAKTPRRNSNHESKSNRLEKLLDQAIACKNRRKFVDAEKVLRATVKEFPDSASAWGLLGGIYLSELAKPLPAGRCFAKATRLSPRSEMASLGLFHALWQTGQYRKAVAELERYQALATCPDYTGIAAELKEKGLWNRLP
jgi:predicted Zn-dependent protease